MIDDRWCSFPPLPNTNNTLPIPFYSILLSSSLLSVTKHRCH